MMNRPFLACLLLLVACTASAFEFVEDKESTGVLTLRDGDRNLFSYRYGDQLTTGVDRKYIRSCYIHPLWSLDGEVLTEDFPKDHYHHRGVFWTWPVVKTRGVTSQTWHPHVPPIRQQFVRWLKRDAGKDNAVLSVENRWMLDGREEVARERVTLRVLPADNDGESIDVELVLEAVGGPLTLQGSPDQNKGYGGFCVRAAPSFQGATILTDTGPAKKDLVNKPHRWVDLSTSKGGFTLFVAPDHPAYPPAFMARNSYAGFVNASWPGSVPLVLEPGKPVTLKYSLYMHRAAADPAKWKAVYDNYTKRAQE